MSSQGLQLLLAIFWILVSKNVLLVDLTIYLNDFQSSRVLDSLYLLKDWLQSSFHHFLECLVMLMFLALENQAYSSPDASELTVCSSDSRFVINKVLRDLNMEMTSLTNFSSSLLFLSIVSLKDWMNSSVMEMVIVRSAWSDVSCQSGWIMWLLSSLDPLHRNIRLMTKLNSPVISEYLVGTGLVGIDSSKLNESVIIKRSSLINGWCGKDGSQNQSLMLKSPVIMSRLLIFTSVSFRYFKTEWDESE